MRKNNSVAEKIKIRKDCENSPWYLTNLVGWAILVASKKPATGEIYGYARHCAPHNSPV
jgi:hypothetical protein